MLPSDQFPDVASLRQPRGPSTRRRCGRSWSRSATTGIERVFDYKTARAGRPGHLRFWQMLQHVVNHGSYHRGQVTTMLRQLGAAPAKSMDLIALLPRARRSAGTKLVTVARSS